MTFKRRYVLYLVLCVLYFGIAGMESCGKDAQTAIDAAETAIDDAKAAEAPEYAPDEFNSAEESLMLAYQQYDGRNFQKSEASARTAEAQAKLALELTLDEKAQQAAAEREQREKDEAELIAATNPSSLFGDTVTDADSQQPTAEEQARFALHDVHFPYDSSELSQSAKGVLALNADFMKNHPSIKVEIEGHCDERGTEEYNLALGTRRARQVMEHMVQLGIDPNRMRTISYGESVPVDTGHTEEAWAKNRRAHFTVLPPE